PHGPIRAEFADEKTESMRDKQRAAAVRAAASDTVRSRAPRSAPTTASWGVTPIPVRDEQNGSDDTETPGRPNRHRRD
ncbi:MAG: hypothetical protein QM673_17435, partial [Gordonia sp. (in: high G+C Gram-positive bacteria)]